MKRSGDQALDQALALHRAPADLGAIRHMQLPKDLQMLLRIAAGDAEVTMHTAQLVGESPEGLREVAIFYLQQLLFADDGDSYRVLGVNPDAPDEQIKLHYRWLVRWLHPDRNSDEWESVFADRVNLAWQDLRTPTRRNAYDLKRSTESLSPNRAREDGPGLVLAAIQTPMPMLSARTVRWLPTIVLASFGLFAIVALGLLYKLQVMDHEASPPAVSQVPAETPQTEPAVVAPAVEVASRSNAVSPSELTVAPKPALAPTPTPVQIPASAPGSVTALMPVPAPTPTPTPISSSPAAAAVALSSAVAPASSQPRLIVQAAKLPVVKPAPDTSSNSVRLARMSPPQPTSRETEARASTSATVSVSGNVPSRTPVVASNQAASDIPNQVPAAAPRMPERLAAANVQPSRQDVSFRPSQEASVLIDDRIAASLISRFSQAYANGDMDRLMQLFTHDAQNGHGDRNAIAEDYRRLFESSERRRIAVSDMSWLTVDNGATIIASFETEVVPRGKVHGEHVSGDIRFDLREEDGELRIYRLSHDNRRS